MNILEIFKEEFGKTKKAFGQHFLTNKHYIDLIVDSCGITEGSQVLEIGPGCGVMTYEILKRGASLTCVEIDSVLVDFLQRYLYFYNNFKVYNSDFLEFDASLLEGKYIFAGNLPYNVSVKITEMCVNLFDKIDHMVFMYQKEVADRIISAPKKKTYSSLSVFLQYHFDIVRVKNISGTNFWPNTKVESTVLRFMPKERVLSPEDEVQFFKIVRRSFLSKRKTLKNNLKDLVDENIILQFFGNINVRGEEIAPEEFVKFYEYVKSCQTDR